MPTLADWQNMERENTVNKSVAASVTGLPLLQSLREGSNVDDSGMGGFYSDDDDSYTGYWLAGDEVGSKPLKEF